MHKIRRPVNLRAREPRDMSRAVHFNNNGGPLREPPPPKEEPLGTTEELVRGQGPKMDLQIAIKQLTEAQQHRESLEAEMSDTDTPQTREALQEDILQAKANEDALRQNVEKATERLKKVQKKDEEKAEKQRRREAAIEAKKKKDTENSTQSKG
jgi:hypothetical protein